MAETKRSPIGIDLASPKLHHGGTRRGIEVTDENGDGGSNDLLMGDVLRTNEKELWFVSAHLVEAAGD